MAKPGQFHAKCNYDTKNEEFSCKTFLKQTSF